MISLSITASNVIYKSTRMKRQQGASWSIIVVMVSSMGRLRGGVCLLVILCLGGCRSTAATCATFAAWLSPAKHIHTVNNAKLTRGFVAITVAPDMESVEVNWQVTADQAAAFATPNYITSVGVYGPASTTQVKPSTRGVLLDFQTLTVTAGQTSSIRLRLTSPELPTILQFMREGMAYVNVATVDNDQGELRGQISVPHCLEAQLEGAGTSRGFANVLISGSETEYAVLTQAAPDASVLTGGAITFTSAVPALPVISLTTINAEWSPLRPNEGQAYDAWLTIDARHLDAFKHVLAGNAAAPQVTVSVMGGGVTMQAMLMGAKGCRKLMSAEDSLFTIARAHRSDWLTVWSMNEGQPDRRHTLEPKYFAHPLEVSLGDSGDAIARRFGMTHKELQMVNPSVMDLASLTVGSTICVLPNWQETVGGNGRKICAD